MTSNIDRAGPTYNSLSLLPISNDGSGHAIVGTATTVSVPSFGIPPNVPQKGSSDLLDSSDGRLTQAVSGVDPTRGSNVIWTQHTVSGGAGTQVRWYEIDPASHSLWQSGTVAPAGLWAFNGAISPDRANDGSTQAFGDSMVLGFNTSSSTSFVAVRMVAKRDAGSQSSPVLVTQSSASQTGCGGNCRWGDYASATPDPAANQSAGQGRVWLTSMWNGNGFSWGTQNWEAVPFAGISSLSPASGYPGLSVVITGSDFTGATAVSFHGAPATFVVNSDTQITATVPAAVTAGAVSVTTPDGTFTSDSAFTLAVHVASIAATSSTAGETVTITGFGFVGATAVKFNGVSAGTAGTGFTVDSNTQITATVPALATDGNVTVTGPGGTSNGVAFDVVPVITDGTGFSPTHGFTGQIVDVIGRSLVTPTALMLDGVSVPFTVVAPGTHLRFVVPTTATSGVISVTTANGIADTSANTPSTFRVNPKITAFAPVSGVAASTVTISGSGFGSLTSVDFAGSPGATVTSSSATQVVVQVPVDAMAGPITLHTTDGDVTTAAFSPLPSISGFGHATYKVGDTATVTGANFTANGAVSATVNGLSVCSPCTATATTVTFKVPNTVTGTVTVTNGDGTATSSAPLLIVPRIDSVSGSGAVGSHVLLTGATFTGTTSVALGNNTEHASFVVGSNGSSLDVTVPANATTGKIGVTNAGGTTLTASDFAIPSAFSVSGFSPARGDYGQTVSITGSGFTGVTRRPVQRDPRRGSDHRRRLPPDGEGARERVGDGGRDGRERLDDHGAGYVHPAPYRRLQSDLCAAGGDRRHHRQRLHGRDPGPVQGPGCDLTVDSDTQITVTVPAGALSGPISVTVAGVTVTSSTSFSVQPGP